MLIYGIRWVDRLLDNRFVTRHEAIAWMNKTHPGAIDWRLCLLNADGTIKEVLL